MMLGQHLKVWPFILDNLRLQIGTAAVTTFGILNVLRRKIDARF